MGLNYIRLLTSTCFIVLYSGSIYGQNNHHIELIPSFEEGQIKKYKITSTSKSFVKEEHYEIFSSTLKDVTIKIVSATANQTHIEWTYDRVMFVDSIEQNNPFSYLMNTLNKRMTIKYVVNSKGVIQSISNSVDLKSQAKQQIDGFIQKLSQSDNFDESSVETFKFQLDMMLSSQELFDGLILGDVYKFHELYGLIFQQGDKNLIPDKDTPADSYIVKLVSCDKSNCQLTGELVSSFSDKKGQKKYAYNLPSYWLEYYSVKWFATVPMNISNSYSIRLANPQ